VVRTILSRPLETFYRRDGCRAIAHALLIESARARVGGVIFQRCEFRTVAAPPVFSRSKQLSTDALILVTGTHRDLRYVAVDHFPVHRILRLFEPGINESNDLTAPFRYQSDTISTRLRMPPPFPVACGNRLNCGGRIALRINAGMIFSTFEEGAGDSVRVF